MSGHDINLAALRKQDLNQLVSLSALLTNASVSRAADVTGISQPSMSKSLARLRKAFGDPLLVRQGNAMHLTPFARGLLVQVQQTLDQVAHLYEPPTPFSPQTARGTVRVGCNDYVQAVLGIPFVRHLREKAPLLSVEFRPGGMLYPEQVLVEGSVDIVVTTDFPSINLRRQFTFSDPFVCIADRGSTAVPARLDLEDFLALRHVDVSPSGTGLLRQLFERAQRRFKDERRVVATVTSFLVLPSLLKDTDLVALVPSRAVSALPAGSVRSIALSFELPAYDVSVWWHSRTQSDPLLHWARSELAALAKELGARQAVR
jgi:DNA-binding transcriptional LysR family regulator